MRQRVAAVALLAFLAISCGESPGAGLFDLGGKPELRDSGNLFEVGCPDGWRYQDRGRLGIWFAPPEPLPGDVESLLFVLPVPEEDLFQDDSVPESAPEFLEALTTLLEVDEGDSRSGMWAGKPAVWLRGPIPAEGNLSTGDTVDGFVAGVRETSGWRLFLIQASPAEVYAGALSEAVAGFRPLDIGETEYADREIQDSGTCSGTFAEVSPPPFQRIEAFVVTFNRSPTVDVTDRVFCQPRPPGETECRHLDAISGVSAHGSRSYRVTIWPTASDEEVEEVRRRLEESPDVAKYEIEPRS